MTFYEALRIRGVLRAQVKSSPMVAVVLTETLYLKLTLPRARVSHRARGQPPRYLEESGREAHETNMSGRRGGKNHWRTCALLLQVLAAAAVDAESTVRSLTNEASQRGGSSEVSGGPHRQAFEALRLQDTVAALPSGFQFAEAVTYDAMNAPQAAGGEGRHAIVAPSQKLHQTQNGGSFSNPSGERYHASATDHYGGLGGSGGSGGYGFPDAMRYYHYGSGPKAYNTEHAYAYEKVYPERSYSTNHATSYEKRYDDNDNKARPKIKRYVYKNPYDKSTTRVVEMHSSRGHPSWAASNENRQIWKPDDMEQFVLGLMRNG
ncbi:hypothetical protein MTO96_048337 [Rhipicephalus appendiculatus]